MALVQIELMATFPITKDKIFTPRLAQSERARPKVQGWGNGILEERHFRHMLCLERKRTERSGKPFMLMLLSGALSESADGEESVGNVVSAVSASTRETDTLGWYEHGRTLAVLFTEIGSSGSNAGLIIDKVTTALQQHLGLEAFDALEVTFRLFPDPGAAQPRDSADLTFYPDSSEDYDSRRGTHFVKRMIDIAGSLLGLLLLWPVFLLLAVLVKFTSEGPVLFRQKRIGSHGTAFTFLKFRSMYSNNDPKIHQEYVASLIQGNADRKQTQDGKASIYKLTHDPRITPLGRFIRKTSLDELPQLLNVLKGDMSLVGPRPPVPYEFEKYDIWHRRRVLEVKPGITGLWQVTGRSRTTFDEMVRLDLNYAKTWSVWMDLKILWRTPMAVVSGSGAC